MKFDAERKQLNQWYWIEKLSTKQIARKLGCCQATAHKLMVKKKIDLREPCQRVRINRNELWKLYIDKRLSSRTIAKKYKCAYSTVDRKIREYGFPIRNLAQAHIKTKRRDFDGDLLEKAYLVGFRIGDLRVRKQYSNSETISIDCGSTRMDQIEHIKKLFERYGHIWISKPTESNRRQIECRVNISFLFLIDKPRLFPKWICAENRLFLSALAGFIDADGSFCICKNSGTFSLGNYNQDLLLQIQKWLTRRGIKSYFSVMSSKGKKCFDKYIKNDDYKILSIAAKKDLYRFTSLILHFLRYSRKKEAAREVLFNIHQRNRKFGYLGMK